MSKVQLDMLTMSAVSLNIGDNLIDPMKGPVTVVDVKDDVEGGQYR